MVTPRALNRRAKTRPPCTRHHVWRVITSVWLMARYDVLAPILAGLGWPQRVIRGVRWLRQREQDGMSLGQRWTKLAPRLGPSFIKFGQSLATRADLIGADTAAALATLQDRLPPEDFAAIQAVIEQELGGDLGALFRQIDEKPVAAASIAQVHFATTNEGHEVAVKILRPGIAAKFAADLAWFAWGAALLDRYVPKLRRLRLPEAVAVFAAAVKMELDLRLEAAAASELRQNFAQDVGFHVPAVHWDYTARRVVTFDRVIGIRLDDAAGMDKLAALGIDRRDILRFAAEAFFKSVFRDGFFHADLHPGNLFIGRDGTILAVDFGIMGRLDKATRLFLADMLLGFLTGDYHRVAEIHRQAGYIPPDQSVAEFAQYCRAIGEPLLNKSLAEISLGKLLAQLFEVTAQFNMETQPQLLLLQKTMVVAEGVGRMLDPSVNMWLLAKPLIAQWMQENRGPKARLSEYIEKLSAFIHEVPGLLRTQAMGFDPSLAPAAARQTPRHQDSTQRTSVKFFLIIMFVFLLGMGIGSVLALWR
ncbi:MAG: 2-polyprenylphenol 6-hydroxylase [Candidatus Symbiobacter sp.]|nr:2-polyprenylphenol 6-hydroxylase [Candidatus Symbiobacter sp.]